MQKDNERKMTLLGNGNARRALRTEKQAEKLAAIYGKVWKQEKLHLLGSIYLKRIRSGGRFRPYLFGTEEELANFIVIMELTPSFDEQLKTIQDENKIELHMLVRTLLRNQ